MPAAPQLKEVKHTQEVTYLYFDNGELRETLGFLNYFFGVTFNGSNGIRSTIANQAPGGFGGFVSYLNLLWNASSQDAEVAQVLQCGLLWMDHQKWYPLPSCKIQQWMGELVSWM